MMCDTLGQLSLLPQTPFHKHTVSVVVALCGNYRRPDACQKLTFLNRSRTREAPTPTNISTNSEPEMEKNGVPASPAIAFASSVLPVPARVCKGIFSL